MLVFLFLLIELVLCFSECCSSAASFVFVRHVVVLFGGLGGAGRFFFLGVGCVCWRSRWSWWVCVACLLLPGAYQTVTTAITYHAASPEGGTAWYVMAVGFMTLARVEEAVPRFPPTVAQAAAPTGTSGLFAVGVGWSCGLAGGCARPGPLRFGLQHIFWTLLLYTSSSPPYYGDTRLPPSAW